MSTSEDESSQSEPEEICLNISNDIYYSAIPKDKCGIVEKRFENNENSSEVPRYGLIRHSLPAYDLWRPLYPCYLSGEKFRNFHRPKLRHYNNGPQSLVRRRTKEFPIKTLTWSIYKFQKKLRFKVIRAINSGMSRDEIINKFFIIRKARDLTAKTGEIFLFEYSEEFPPALSQVGMAANVKTLVNPIGHSCYPGKNILQRRPVINSTNQNIHSENRTIDMRENHIKPVTKEQRKIGFDQLLKDRSITRDIYYHKLKPGHKMLVLENNMYRAPIYPHEFRKTDFLVIRTRNCLYIRPVLHIFTVGQTFPLVAVPPPTDQSIARFRLDLSNLYIHKLFQESACDPPCLNFNFLIKLFPDYNKDTLKHRLKNNGALLHKVGNDLFFYRGTSKYGLASKLELRKQFTPEQYCLNMSMLAARERLRELNYTESMILPENEVEIEPETLAAPWNTTKTALRASMHQIYLDLKAHQIDPTGRQREGFSCIAWSKSPTEDQLRRELKSRQHSSTNPLVQQSLSDQSNRTIVPNTPLEVKSLQQKIKREKLERLAIYEREAAFIAKVQSDVLSSREVFSSEEESEQDDSENDFDAMHNQQISDLNKLIISNITVQELNHEKEEEERNALIRKFCINTAGAGDTFSKATKKQTETTRRENHHGTRVLKIIRTYNTEGVQVERTEIVREPKIIALYVKRKQEESLAQPTPIVNMPNGRNDRRHSFWSRVTHKTPIKRRASLTLGRGELCRADGMTLTISKKVLDMKEMKRIRRLSRAID